MLQDLLNGFSRLVSLVKGAQAAATLTGSYVDAREIEGPVYALVGTGNATGSPSAQSAVFTLLEADDSSGTNSQAVALQSDAITLTADLLSGRIRGVLTKPFVAVKCVLSFTSGTSPKTDVYGVIEGTKKRV